MRKLIHIAIALLIVMPSLAFAQKNDSKEKDHTVTIYYTRHGKTILNTMSRVQGWSDTPLTPAGVEVAEHLGRGFQAEGVIFKSVYSSDLGRARETARIILDKKRQPDLPIQEEIGIRETGFGSYEGADTYRMGLDAALFLGYKSESEMFSKIGDEPDLIKRLVDTYAELETLGIGEDYATVKARGQKALREIAEKEAANGGGNVLVVGHSMSIAIILADIDSEGKTPSLKGHVPNASVSKIVYKDGKFFLESYGDLRYVEKGSGLKK